MPLGCDQNIQNHWITAMTAPDKPPPAGADKHEDPIFKVHINWTPQRDDAQAWPHSIADRYTKAKNSNLLTCLSRWLGTDVKYRYGQSADTKAFHHLILSHKTLYLPCMCTWSIYLRKFHSINLALQDNTNVFKSVTSLPLFLFATQPHHLAYAN